MRQSKQRHSTARRSTSVSRQGKSGYRTGSYRSCFESRWWPWFVFIVTVVIRIRYVTLTENIWILHPDEIFQSVEVAFSEEYGYGFRPYEFLPALDNVNVSTEKQTLTSGMYALRSPLYPRVFMAVLSIAKATGLDSNPLLVCRVFNVIVTSLLPVAVYSFVLMLFNSRTLAFLTCALSALERHLSVFGTHTLVNSFLSPFIFYGLSVVIQSGNGRGNQTTDENSCHRISSLGGLDMADESDPNGNLVNAQANCVNKQAHCRISETRDYCLNKSYLYPHVNGSVPGVKEMSDLSSFTTCLGGFVLTMVCYIRPDSALFCTAVMLAHLLTQPTSFVENTRQMLPALFGGAIAGVMCAADDMLWYGAGVLSPVQWFRFNVYSGKSHRIYGYQTSAVYLNAFVEQHMDLLVNLTLFLAIIYCKHRYPQILLRFRLFCAIVLTFILVILFYSSTGHKEIRFIHNGIVLYVILLAYAAYIVLCAIDRALKNRLFVDATLIGLLAIYACNSYYKFPCLDDSSITQWAHGNAKNSRDANACLDWVRRQDDVTGVLIDASLYSTTAFVGLKHNVPLTVRIHNEYYVYDLRNDRESSKIRLIFNFTDFFHSTNEAYRTKLLAADDTYNYVISKRSQVFFLNSTFSLSKAYSYGQFHVFRRNFTSAEEVKLHKQSVHVPFGMNATVLEYEANWLITNARYEKALERIKEALKLNQSRVRLYQQLFVCYAKLNNVKMLHQAQEECFQQFGKKKCVRQQQKVTLHSEYDNIG